MTPEAMERRVLILAPIGKDASLLAGALENTGVACASFAQLSLEVRRGAAALLVTEEALAEHDTAFAHLCANQPRWSDLPVLVLTRTGANSVTAELAVRTLGNVTLLERPVRPSTLISAVRTALRARERQYQVRAHLEERERADRRKDEFLATLAHELRNPLAPIRTALDVLQLTGTQPPPPDLLATMERQLLHLVRLVDDLMDVSRVTRGTVRLERKPLDLREAIGAALEISRPLAQAAQHALSITLPPRPLMVDADPVRMAQVVSNLLNNAIKYTEAGGRIGLVARAEAGRAVISVTDSGRGISEEALPHLFEMFYQDASDERPLLGLGVGLTLVRSIVELHGGSVTARSEGRGHGSEFTVTLPLAQERARAITMPAPAATTW